MKRVFLLLITNFAVMIVLSVVAHILGVDRYLTANGLNIGALFFFSAIFGFGGAFISLFISKWMAVKSTGARVIESPADDAERWLVDTVHRLADKAGIDHPEVAVYEGAANAFATGASRNNALVAVSTGLLESMDKTEVEAVLGHEIAHITNGDMVTLTLIQGVVNTFVYFLARLVASAFQRDNRGGGAYFAISMVCQILFGALASIIVAYFSRQREFRADAGSAKLNGAKPMISALERLGGLEPGELPKSVAASGITGRQIMSLFASHPPIEERIAALS